MQIGIKENKDSTSLDPKLAPMLWFHYYNYDMSLEESDDEDNEESSDDDDVSDEDEFSEISVEDESTEETDDDGINEAKEVNDTLLLYSISSKQLVAHSKLDDLKDHFYWITLQVEIDVHMLDITKRAWVKVDTLGDRAFIVNTIENFGASVNAKEIYLQGSCIYFFMRRDKGLYVHNMERGTTTALNPGADVNVAAQILMPAF
uniref:KIB1-4 beta-propeller domain-containing protein n=1 Tax=Oryza punctata TaxID=4537 RepID=A0A0E0M0T5_ORYPU